MEYEEIDLINNKEQHNFELWIEGKRSFIDYGIEGEKIFLFHTEVPGELEGRGVAAALVEKTLRYIEEHGLKLIPLCPYVQSFLKRHQEWQRLVSDNEL